MPPVSIVSAVACRATLATVAVIASGCGGEAEVGRAETTPDKQFVFEGVRIEERTADGVRWVGTARRAAGDLSAADAEAIRIDHYRADGEHFVIEAPRGQLGFGERGATLDSVRVTTPERGVVTGGKATYAGDTERVVVEGPIELTAPGLRATATSGEIDLAAGRVDVAGPVIGRFEPKPAARRSVTPR